MPWERVKPVIDSFMPYMCRTPYPLHPKGCPNWNKKEGCPPQCPELADLIDLNQDVWAIWTKFDLGEHVAKLKVKYPEWTDRQLKCCSYWQSKARKALKNEIEAFLGQHPGLRVIMTPEAAGVHITATMDYLDIKLEWPPKHWTYQVVLAGMPSLC